MTELSSLNISTDSLNSVSAPEEVLEMIGQKVLSSWDISGSDLSQECGGVLSQIMEILSKPAESLPPNWDTRVKELLDKLSPADFAVHGKKICLAILDVKAAQKSRPPSRERGSPIRPRSEIGRQPYIRSERSYIRQIKKVSPNAPKKEVQAQIYSEFPPWLPTITDY